MAPSAERENKMEQDFTFAECNIVTCINKDMYHKILLDTKTKRWNLYFKALGEDPILNSYIIDFASLAECIATAIDLNVQAGTSYPIVVFTPKDEDEQPRFVIFPNGEVKEFIPGYYLGEIDNFTVESALNKFYEDAVKRALR